MLCDWSLFTGLQSRTFSTKLHGMVNISEMSRSADSGLQNSQHWEIEIFEKINYAQSQNRSFWMLRILVKSYPFNIA